MQENILTRGTEAIEDVLSALLRPASREAFEALSEVVIRRKDIYTEPLLELAAHHPANLGLIWIVWQLGDRRAVSVLLQSLRETRSAVREAALQALQHLDARDALPEIEKATHDRSRTVRRQAAETLRCLSR